MSSRMQLAAGVVVVLLLVAAGAVLLGGGGSGPATPDLAAAAAKADARFVERPYREGIGVHTDEEVRYPTNPPVGGPHAFAWAQDGNYVGQGTPPLGQLVHALEHGRIAIQYRRGLEREQVRRLEALYDEAPDKVLLFENTTDMPCDVAVTAWSRGMLCPRVDDAALDAIRAFRDTYRDQGPERV
jgi:hypothetical protein